MLRCTDRGVGNHHEFAVIYLAAVVLIASIRLWPPNGSTYFALKAPSVSLSFPR
jgi:hypothetical protein